jgi:hypothetical protein
MPSLFDGQVIELYTEDGRNRPFFCILETPGSGNVVRAPSFSISHPAPESITPMLPTLHSHARSSLRERPSK